MPKRYAIIVAGGAGQRMAMDIPKQFLELHGYPILMHTIRAFHEYDPGIEIILSLRSANKSFWKTLCLQYNFKIPHTIVSGGRKRYDSVLNGLNVISGPGLVAIHDGVRPAISKEVIGQSFESAEKYGSGIPVLRINDTVRQFDEEGSVIIDRSKLRAVQTPQTFDIERLKEAYAQEYNESFTDDSSVWEAAGNRIQYVHGDLKNIKITRKEDLDLVKIFLSR